MEGEDTVSNLVRLGTWSQKELPLFPRHPDQPLLCLVLCILKCEVEQRFVIWGLELYTFSWTEPLVFTEIKAKYGEGVRPD